NDFLIGISIIDELLFSAFTSKSRSPILWVLNVLRSRELHRSGLVIYPLHSFGILGAGLFQWRTRSEVSMVSKELGIALSPQTNSWDRTRRFVNHCRRTFGIRRSLPNDLLEHWRRSRPVRWLERNPLLVM